MMPALMKKKEGKRKKGEHDTSIKLLLSSSFAIQVTGRSEYIVAYKNEEDDTMTRDDTHGYNGHDHRPSQRPSVGSSSKQHNFSLLLLISRNFLSHSRTQTSPFLLSFYSLKRH